MTKSLVGRALLFFIFGIVFMIVVVLLAPTIEIKFSDEKTYSLMLLYILILIVPCALLARTAMIFKSRVVVISYFVALSIVFWVFPYGVDHQVGITPSHLPSKLVKYFSDTLGNISWIPYISIIFPEKIEDNLASIFAGELSNFWLMIVFYSSFIFFSSIFSFFPINFIKNNGTYDGFFSNRYIRNSFLLSCISLIILGLIVTKGISEYEGVWRLHFKAFPWMPLTISLIFLTFLLQRTYITPSDLLSDGVIKEDDLIPSIEPVFKAYSQDPDLDCHQQSIWNRQPPILQSAIDDYVSEELVTEVLDGHGFIYYGTADKHFYGRLSAITEAVQDVGGMTLIICPDGASEAVEQKALIESKAAFPEVTRRSVRVAFDSADIRSVVDHGRVFDLVIVEESQVGDLLSHFVTQAGSALERLRAVIIIDFHALDACQLYFHIRTLEEFEINDRAEKVGMYILSLYRDALDTQANKFLSFLPGETNTRVDSSNASKVACGQLLWKAGPELREKLLSRADINAPDLTYFRTAAYLAANDDGKHIDDSVQLLRGFVSPKGTAFDNFDLKFLLNEKALLTDEMSVRLNGMVQQVHFSPKTDFRILTVMDTGNCADAIGMRPAYWAECPDVLLHIVSTGYLGRQFLLDRLNENSTDPRGFTTLYAPFAQQPGIGVAEIAQKLADQMRSSDGIDERRAAALIKQSSGAIADYLSITATRSGLTKLFKQVDPSFQEQVQIRYRPGQYEAYCLESTGRCLRTSTLVDLRIENENVALTTNTHALADNGLLFSGDTRIRVGEQFVLIQDISEQRDSITVSTIGRGDLGGLFPEPVHYFKRHYVVDAGFLSTGEKVPNFVGESFILEVDQTHEQLALIQATIHRKSTMRLTISSDHEPLQDDGALLSAPTEITPVEYRRPFCNILLGKWAMKIDESDDSTVVVRTLAAALQTVVGLGFPELRSRLAVFPLGGDCSVPIETNHEGRQSASNFAATYFPTGEINGFSLDQVLNYKDPSNEDYEDSGFTKPWQFGFAVVEDGEHDLGVCRRICDNWSTVRKRMEDFLTWASGQPSWNEVGVFDAESALKYLKGASLTSTNSSEGEIT